MNSIAVQGAVEITSIDEEKGIVKGRIDAKIDSDNSVNGNFEVTLCD